MRNFLRAGAYFVTLALATAWNGARVMVAASLRVAYQPGGIYDTAGRTWGRLLLRATGIPVRVVGREHLPSTPVVYIANHVSFVDIWVLLQELPGSIRFVFKKEMARIPVFGQALTAARHIAIDRRNQVAAFSAYDEAATAIRDGVSAAVFAEGTRSADGMLRPFKKGPLVLAISAGVPVIPVYIAGTFAIMPRGAIAPRGGTVTIHIGTPIPTVGMDYEARDALAQQTRAAILRLARDAGELAIAAPGAVLV